MAWPKRRRTYRSRTRFVQMPKSKKILKIFMKMCESPGRGRGKG